MPRRRDWREAAGNSAIGDALLDARLRWEHGLGATLRRVRGVYRNAARGVRDDLRAATPGTFRDRHLLTVLASLERRASELSDQVLTALRHGIRLSVDAAIAGPQAVTELVLAPAYRPQVVAEYFGQVNERALVSLLDRSGPDGLVLSERTWRIGRRWRRAVQTAVEDGVARGLDAKTLGREVQRYLQPGVHTAHKAATRRRLKVPRDVSYEATRLVRTELGNAFHEGTIAGNRAAPSYEGIFWRLSLSHVIPDVCDDLAGNRRYGRPGFYPTGKEPTKPHAQCMCVILPAHEDLDAFTDRLLEWIDDPGTQPDLERWYEGVARPILGRPLAPLHRPSRPSRPTKGETAA